MFTIYLEIVYKHGKLRISSAIMLAGEGQIFVLS